MYKGIITKIEKKFFIVKTEDSDIERVKIRKNIKVGENVTYTKRDIYKGFSRISYSQLGASLSMLIILAVVGFTVFQSEDAVYATVTYDVNPSLLFGINEDFMVVFVEALDDRSEDVIPSDYLDRPIVDVIFNTTQNCVAHDYQGLSDPVMIGIQSNNDLDALRQVLISMEPQMGDMPLIIVELTEESLTKSIESGIPACRLQLNEYLEAHDESLDYDTEFVRNTYQLLMEHMEMDNGVLKIDEDATWMENKIDDDAIEDSLQDSEATSTNEDQDQEDADSEQEDDAISDDSDVTDNDETTVEEETTEEEQAEIQAQITAQKQKVDAAYVSYRNKRDEVDQLNLQIKDVRAQIDSDQATLEKQEANQEELQAKTSAYETEKKVLEDNLATKEELESTAASERDAKIQSTASDQAQVDSLESEAASVYSPALSQYNSAATAAKNLITQVKSNYEKDRASASVAGASTEYYDAIIAHLNELLNTIDSKGGPLTSNEEAIQNVIKDYNASYTNLQSAQATRDSILSSASSLQRQIDQVIAEAESIYQVKIKELEALYEGDLQRLEVIINTLTLAESSEANFIKVIQESKDKIQRKQAFLEDLLSKLSKAIAERDSAYNKYLSEKSLLDAMEDDS